MLYTDFFFDLLNEASETEGRGAEYARSKQLKHQNHGMWYKISDPRQKIVAKTSGDKFWWVTGKDDNDQYQLDPVDLTAVGMKEPVKPEEPKKRGRPPKAAPTPTPAKVGGSLPTSQDGEQRAGLSDDGEGEQAPSMQSFIKTPVTPDEARDNPLVAPNAPRFDSVESVMDYTVKASKSITQIPRGLYALKGGNIPGFYADRAYSEAATHVWNPVTGEFDHIATRKELYNNVKDALKQYRVKMQEVDKRNAVRDARRARHDRVMHAYAQQPVNTKILNATTSSVKSRLKAFNKNYAWHSEKQVFGDAFKKYGASVIDLLQEPTKEKALAMLSAFDIRSNGTNTGFFLHGFRDAEGNVRNIPEDMQDAMNGTTFGKILGAKMVGLLGSEEYEKRVPVHNVASLMSSTAFYKDNARLADLKIMLDSQDPNKIRSVVIDGEEYHGIMMDMEDNTLKQQLVERHQLLVRYNLYSEIVMRKGQGTITPDEAANKAAKYYQTIKLHNNKIKLVSDILSTTQIADLDSFNGNTLQEKILNATVSGIDRALSRSLTPPSEGTEAVKQSLTALSQATDREQFEKTWKELVYPSLINCEELTASKSYLAECVAAMHQAIQGKKVFIPLDDQLGHIDVIGVSKTNVTSFQDLEHIVDNISLLEVTFDMESVKQGNKGAHGAAGSASEKLDYMVWDESLDRADLEFVVSGGPDLARGFEWVDIPEEERNPKMKATKKKVDIDINEGHQRAMSYWMDFVKKNAKDISEYFGEPMTPGFENRLFDVLSRGGRPKLDEKGRVVAANSDRLEERIRARDKVGQNTIRLFSAYGHLSEFIFNRKAKQQLFSNEVYSPDGISTSDGVNSISLFRFTFKNSVKHRENRNIYTPHGNIGLQMRTGSPDMRNTAYSLDTRKVNSQNKNTTKSRRRGSAKSYFNTEVPVDEPIV